MTNRTLTVLTGASRGMGAAMAEQLLQPGAVLLCISRGRSDTLEAQAGVAGASVLQWQRDLGQPVALADELHAWLTAQDHGTITAARLINNAGVISRIGPVDADRPESLSQALRVGLEAPVLLCAAFLRATAHWRATRRVLNISSGLGRRAMAGSATYCAAKAGLDHLSRAMALDEASRPNGARIVSLAPGVIDTDMQHQLRSADASGFPDQHRFLALKSDGQLSSAAGAAAQVLAFLNRSNFGDEVIADVRG